MPGEPARGVEPVGDLADDRVRVGRHVVEPGPGAGDRHARRRRVPPREPRRASRPTSVLVDGLVRRPSAGAGLRHREHERVAAPAEVEARLGLDRQRQVAGEARRPAAVSTSWRDERPDGELDAELRARAPPTTRPSRARGRPRRARARRSAPGPRRRAPTARRTSSRVIAGRVRRPVLAAEDGAEHVVDVEAGDPRGVDPLDRDAERRLHLAPPLELVQPLVASSRGRGSRPARRARRPSERKNPTLSRASRTSGADENCCRTPPSALPRRTRGDRRRRRRARPRPRRRRARWYAMEAPTTPAPATTSRLPAIPRAPRPPSASRSRSGGRTSGRSAHALPARRRASAPRAGGTTPSSRGAPPSRGRALLGRLADDGRDLLGERRRERRDGADGARLATAVDERLGADEDVEAVEEVALERVPRACPRPSSRRRCPPPRAVAPASPGRRRTRRSPRTRRRRTAAARRPRRPRAGARAARRASSLKYGGPITATASAPASAACAASATVSASSARRSARRRAPARRPPRASARARGGARRASERTASPFVPNASTPSSPAPDEEVGVRPERVLVERAPRRRRAASRRRRSRRGAAPSARRAALAPTRSTVPAMRRARVSGRFASSTH